MPRLTTLNRMKKGLTAIGFIIVLTALTGFQPIRAAAQAPEQLWSIVVHFRYESGFEFDYVLATGVPAGEVSAILQDCGRSHRTGSVVRYYCYAVPD